MSNCEFCGAEPFPSVLEGYTTWKCNSYATDLRDKADGPVVQSVSCRIRELDQHKERILELENIVKETVKLSDTEENFHRFDRYRK